MACPRQQRIGADPEAGAQPVGAVIDEAGLELDPLHVPLRSAHGRHGELAFAEVKNQLRAHRNVGDPSIIAPVRERFLMRTS